MTDAKNRFASSRSCSPILRVSCEHAVKPTPGAGGSRLLDKLEQHRLDLRARRLMPDRTASWSNCLRAATVHRLNSVETAVTSIEALSPVFGADPGDRFCVTWQGQRNLVQLGARLAGNARALVGLYVTESAEPEYNADFGTVWPRGCTGSYAANAPRSDGSKLPVWMHGISAGRIGGPMASRMAV